VPIPVPAAARPRAGSAAGSPVAIPFLEVALPMAGSAAGSPVAIPFLEVALPMAGSGAGSPVARAGSSAAGSPVARAGPAAALTLETAIHPDSLRAGGPLPVAADRPRVSRHQAQPRAELISGRQVTPPRHPPSLHGYQEQHPVASFPSGLQATGCRMRGGPTWEPAGSLWPLSQFTLHNSNYRRIK